MKFSVAFEYPVRYIPRGARKPREEILYATSEIDIRELNGGFHSPDAFVARNPTENALKVYRERAEQQNLVDCLGRLSGGIHLRGHDGALWEDTWRTASERFFDIDGPQLREGGDIYRDPDFERRIRLYSSPRPDSEPQAGAIHWRRWGPRQDARADLIVLRQADEARMPGRSKDLERPLKEMISSGLDAARSDVGTYVQNHFLWAHGSLHMKVPPPARSFSRENGWFAMKNHIRGSDALASGAYFRFDEYEQVKQMSEKFAGRARQVADYLGGDIQATSVDPDYMAIDKVDLGIRALRRSLHRLHDGFSELPDRCLEKWMQYRRLADSWSPVEGDPRKIIEAFVEFRDAIPRQEKIGSLVFDQLSMQCLPFLEQAPTLDLRERVRPVDDIELAALSL
ncbi:hypothetical protein [Bosea sp. ANAM02]|uniref:hypothetical protein n=1 Tax=Bosea sp. ANAM02 TaxID=2020412 RepID=UPI00140EEBCF|nr:hypothetical protein [Bosea sp. ANAM02]BCB22445.1 hypothetical protein OCUBac02_53390 [Bosea sp. ANAM02]